MDIEKLKSVLKGKSGARLKLWMEICARCGLCAEGCHFFQSDPRPEHVPAYRLKPLAELMRRKGEVDEAFMQWLVDVAYGTCTMCQRCTMFCPHGISVPFLVRATRSLAVSQGMVPQGLASGLANALEVGNNLGITQDEYLETVEWQLEELQAEMPDAKAPINKKGAEVLVTFHPRDIKFYPQNLYGYLKLYNAAGLDFTLTSERGWDSTNLGLFAGDDAGATEMCRRVVEAGENLGVKTVLSAEWGHSIRALKFEGPNWLKRDLPFETVAPMKMWADLFRAGRLKLKKHFHKEPATFQDSCNFIRNAGHFEDSRLLLNHVAADLREMHPNGVHTYCCGSGGGHGLMSEYKQKRLATAKAKAEAIRATGAEVAIVACHNCEDGIRDGLKAHEVPAQVHLFSGYLAEAVDLD